MRRYVPLAQLPGVPNGSTIDLRRYAARIPFLQPSGARGAPLASERPFIVFNEQTQRYESAAQPAEGAPQDLTHQFPWLFAPVDSFPIVNASTIQVIGAGSTVTLITLAEAQRGYAGVINAFGAAAADFADLLWSFVVKGRAVQPITNINFQFGPVNDPKALPGAGVLLNPGDDFNVTVQNTSAAAVAGVQARIEGYYWRTGVS